MSDEMRDLFEELTLYAVAAMFVVSVAVGYLGGSDAENIVFRALVAAAAVGFIGWLLTWILATPQLQRRSPDNEAATDMASKAASPARGDEPAETPSTQ